MTCVPIPGTQDAVVTTTASRNVAVTNGSNAVELLKNEKAENVVDLAAFFDSNLAIGHAHSGAVTVFDMNREVQLSQAAANGQPVSVHASGNSIVKTYIQKGSMVTFDFRDPNLNVRTDLVVPRGTTILASSADSNPVVLFVETAPSVFGFYVIDYSASVTDTATATADSKMRLIRLPSGQLTRPRRVNKVHVMSSLTGRRPEKDMVVVVSSPHEIVAFMLNATVSMFGYFSGYALDGRWCLVTSCGDGDGEYEHEQVTLGRSKEDPSVITVSVITSDKSLRVYSIPSMKSRTWSRGPLQPFETDGSGASIAVARDPWDATVTMHITSSFADDGVTPVIRKKNRFHFANEDVGRGVTELMAGLAL